MKQNEEAHHFKKVHKKKNSRWGVYLAGANDVSLWESDGSSNYSSDKEVPPEVYINIYTAVSTQQKWKQKRISPETLMTVPDVPNSHVFKCFCVMLDTGSTC